MARSFFNQTTGAKVGLVGATVKTVLSLKAPTNQRVAIQAIEVMFDGSLSSATPVEVYLQRVGTSDGTGSTANPVAKDEDIGTAIQSTGKSNYSAEPTYGTGAILKSWLIHPQAGVLESLPFPGEEILKGGGIVGLWMKAPAGVNVVANIDGEE